MGIDSAFYEPPSEAVLAAYASALPRGFPCVSKVWDRITAKRFNHDPRWGNLAGLLNPDFMNPGLFQEAVLGPYSRAFRDHAGCFVFEFQAMRGRDVPDVAVWAGQLDRFLQELPRDWRYAVELRNPELLDPQHGAVLAHHGVAHVFNSWTGMPPIGAQLDLPWVFTADFTTRDRCFVTAGRTDSVSFFKLTTASASLAGSAADLILLIAAATRPRWTVDSCQHSAEGNAPGTIRACRDVCADYRTL